MPRTPDRRPGPQEEDDRIAFQPVASDPAEAGEFLYNQAGEFRAKDSLGIFEVRGEERHKVLQQLIHFIDEGPAEGFASGAYCETVGDAFPTSVTWYTASDKLHKIVELTITRDFGQKPTAEVWKVYSAADVLLATVTDAITYSGPFETSRTRTIA